MNMVYDKSNKAIPEAEVWQIQELTVIVLGGRPGTHIQVTLEQPFTCKHHPLDIQSVQNMRQFKCLLKQFLFSCLNDQEASSFIYFNHN